MATSIYKSGKVYTIDGQELEISPLKIKYMREFMDTFEYTKFCKDDDEMLDLLSECVRICMKQFHPEFSVSLDIVQDNFDINSIYEILDFAAGIKLKGQDTEDIDQQLKKESNDASWENLDLAKLETEVFLLGIWQNYEQLELSLSIQELMTIISTRRELDFEEKKFFAALQGVELGDGTDSSGKVRGQKEWEDLKARVFSKGQATDSNDILALQGQNAVKAGFGIGMGIDYEDLRSS